LRAAALWARAAKLPEATPPLPERAVALWMRAAAAAFIAERPLPPPNPFEPLKPPDCREDMRLLLCPSARDSRGRENRGRAESIRDDAVAGEPVCDLNSLRLVLPSPASLRPADVLHRDDLVSVLDDHGHVSPPRQIHPQSLANPHDLAATEEISLSAVARVVSPAVMNDRRQAGLVAASLLAASRCVRNDSEGRHLTESCHVVCLSERCGPS
jgi:hypothetical protein